MKYKVKFVTLLILIQTAALAESDCKDNFAKLFFRRSINSINRTIDNVASMIEFPNVRMEDSAAIARLMNRPELNITSIRPYHQEFPINTTTFRISYTHTRPFESDQFSITPIGNGEILIKYNDHVYRAEATSDTFRLNEPDELLTAGYRNAARRNTYLQTRSYTVTTTNQIEGNYLIASKLGNTNDLLVYKTNNRLEILNARTGEVSMRFPGRFREVEGINLIENTDKIVLTQKGNSETKIFRVLNKNSGEEILLIDDIQNYILSDNAQFAVIKDSTANLKIVNLQNGEIRNIPSGDMPIEFSRLPHDVHNALSSDGRKIVQITSRYTRQNESFINLFDTQTGELITSTNITSEERRLFPRGIQLLPDDSKAIISYDMGTVMQYDLTNAEINYIQQFSPNNLSIFSTRSSSNGDYLIIATMDGSMVIDTRTGNIINTLAPSRMFDYHTAFISNDGREVIKVTPANPRHATRGQITHTIINMPVYNLSTIY